jgi:hypothetical protein
MALTATTSDQTSRGWTAPHGSIVSAGSSGKTTNARIVNSTALRTSSRESPHANWWSSRFNTSSSDERTATVTASMKNSSATSAPTPYVTSIDTDVVSERPSIPSSTKLRTASSTAMATISAPPTIRSPSSSSSEKTAAARLISANVRIPADFCDHSRSSPRNIPSAVARTSFETFVWRYTSGSTALNTERHLAAGAAVAPSPPTESSRPYADAVDSVAYSLLYSGIY